MTELPETLTLQGRMFLLAYDPERGRMTGRADLDLLLRAAALADLLRLGLLRDESGRPVVAGPAPAGLDPLLADTLRRLAEGRSRPWHRWVAAGRRGTARAVRARLADQGLVRLEEYRALGLFTRVRMEPRDQRARKALAGAVSAALRDPLSRVPVADAALVALADAARLSVVLNSRQRREHKQRIADLAALCGPVPAALRRAVRDRQTAAASG
ncbi:GPP34 family phosphoprotein [Kitasatospora sp. NPDC006697]|uniref:GOLPH3/VPS74 family protein n=1 Tax=Kitasatospora sp. NPDC006697 TaxID=3364020 RepID=UPI0036A9F1FF